MSMFTDVSSLRGQFWAEIFCFGIRNLREKRGRSVEQAARLADMMPADWIDLEQGRQLPDHRDELARVAYALDVRVVDVVALALLSLDAWR
jgi:transcriptional regulator with XRE-family HTH domain